MINKFINRVKKNFSKKKERKNSILAIKNHITELNDLLLNDITSKIQSTHTNPFNAFGRKCFSQSDEDGLTFEIIKRLKLEKFGYYAELGVGDGTENNSLFLASLGWKGFWVGGSDLAFDVPNNDKFFFQKEWISLKNIKKIFDVGLKHFEIDSIDLISVDLDGNDFYIVESLLKEKIKPKIFILEYNGKFPPPLKFKIDYNEDHIWNEDDYFGSSLQTYFDLLSSYDYKLICCNSHTGANCFFVQNRYAELFPEVPDNIEKIYSEPRYILYKKFMHKKSIKLIKQILS
tara:strand:- start:353 stop:1219 length:867 start_codon:yes stop_codon:yes gene_type:complete